MHVLLSGFATSRTQKTASTQLTIISICREPLSGLSGGPPSTHLNPKPEAYYTLSLNTALNPPNHLWDREVGTAAFAVRSACGRDAVPQTRLDQRICEFGLYRLYTTTLQS